MGDSGGQGGSHNDAEAHSKLLMVFRTEVKGAVLTTLPFGRRAIERRHEPQLRPQLSVGFSST
jgi:hypothetical protein